MTRSDSVLGSHLKVKSWVALNFLAAANGRRTARRMTTAFLTIVVVAFFQR